MKVSLWVLLAAIMLSGCASHTVKYSFGAPPLHVEPSHHIRVAVAPVPRETYPYQCGSIAYGAVSFNRSALTELLTQHLSHERVFAAVEITGANAAKPTPGEFSRLRARGIDALLLPRVVQIQGGSGSSAGVRVTEQVGMALDSPALLAGSLSADLLEKKFCVATSTVEFKLVSTANGNTLWYGTGLGTVNGAGGLNKAVDASLGAAFANLIKDLCAAQLDERR